MALDHGARAANADALDHVGVQRALHQIAGIFDASGVGFEHLDEHAPDDLALLLGIGDAGQRGQELGLRASTGTRFR